MSLIIQEENVMIKMTSPIVVPLTSIMVYPLQAEVIEIYADAKFKVPVLQKVTLVFRVMPYRRVL